MIHETFLFSRCFYRPYGFLTLKIKSQNSHTYIYIYIISTAILYIDEKTILLEF